MPPQRPGGAMMRAPHLKGGASTPQQSPYQPFDEFSGAMLAAAGATAATEPGDQVHDKAKQVAQSKALRSCLKPSTRANTEANCEKPPPSAQKGCVPDTAAALNSMPAVRPRRAPQRCAAASPCCVRMKIAPTVCVASHFSLLVSGRRSLHICRSSAHGTVNQQVSCGMWWYAYMTCTTPLIHSHHVARHLSSSICSSA
jgi:hypothetical protein